MRPRVIVHNEISADGRMDFYAGDIALYYEVAGRLSADASLAGSETIIKGMAQFGGDITDEPAEDSPPAADRPLFAVVDSRGRIDQWPLIRKQPYWGRIVVLCSEATPRPYLDGLRALGIDYIVRGSDRVDLLPSLEELAGRFDVKALRVDSGGRLSGVLLRAGLVDEVSVLIDPCVVGGESPASIFRAADLDSADGITPLKLLNFERLQGDILWLRYEVVRGA